MYILYIYIYTCDYTSLNMTILTSCCCCFSLASSCLSCCWICQIWAAAVDFGVDTRLWFEIQIDTNRYIVTFHNKTLWPYDDLMMTLWWPYDDLMMTLWWPYDVFLPIGPMYAIYGDIYHQYTQNVSIYTSTMDPMGYVWIHLFHIWVCLKIGYIPNESQWYIAI